MYLTTNYMNISLDDLWGQWKSGIYKAFKSLKMFNPLD
jgi:hypothetical protein